MTRDIAIAALIVSFAAGCDFPRDAAGTLERVRQEQVLRVGVGARPPWVSLQDGAVSGIEVGLMRGFAAAFGAEIEWVQGTESALVRALRERRIDVLVAGLTTRSPWVAA